MHKVVGLVVLIPTSPRSSKTESGCKSYHRFRKHVFPVGEVPGRPAPAPDGPAPRPADRPVRRTARRLPALMPGAAGAKTEAARPLARRNSFLPALPPGVPVWRPGLPALPPGRPVWRPGLPALSPGRPAPRPVCQAFRQAARKLSDLPPNGHISFGYKRGFFPNGFP